MANGIKAALILASAGILGAIIQSQCSGPTVSGTVSTQGNQSPGIFAAGDVTYNNITPGLASEVGEDLTEWAQTADANTAALRQRLIESYEQQLPGGQEEAAAWADRFLSTLDQRREASIQRGLQEASKLEENKTKAEFLTQVALEEIDRRARALTGHERWEGGTYEVLAPLPRSIYATSENDVREIIELRTLRLSNGCEVGVDLKTGGTDSSYGYPNSPAELIVRERSRCKGEQLSFPISMRLPSGGSFGGSPQGVDLKDWSKATPDDLSKLREEIGQEFDEMLGKVAVR